MKKTLLLLLALATASLTMAQEEAHRYEIKSGIAHSETRLNDHVTPAVQYFDNFGDCEAMIQTIDMGALGSYDNTTITKKEKAWFVNSGGAKEFQNPTADLTFVNPSQAVIDKYKLVDTGKEEAVLGRMCRIFTYGTTQGRKTIYNTVWIYKGITMKSVMKRGRQESFFEMTDFQENATISPEVFAIPE